MKPDGVFLSNVWRSGAGHLRVENIKKLVGHVPVFAFAWAPVVRLGARRKTFKLNSAIMVRITPSKIC